MRNQYNKIVFRSIRGLKEAADHKLLCAIVPSVTAAASKSKPVSNQVNEIKSRFLQAKLLNYTVDS